jgi:hypothetical protein
MLRRLCALIVVLCAVCVVFCSCSANDLTPWN